MYARTSLHRDLQARIRVKCHVLSNRVPVKVVCRKKQPGIGNQCCGSLQGNIWGVGRVRAGNEPAPGGIWAMLMIFLYTITFECVKPKALCQQISLCMCETGRAVGFISLGSRLQCPLVRSPHDCFLRKQYKAVYIVFILHWIKTYSKALDSFQDQGLILAFFFWKGPNMVQPQCKRRELDKVKITSPG